MNWIRRLLGIEPRSPYGQYAPLVESMKRQHIAHDLAILAKYGGTVPPGYTGSIRTLIFERMIELKKAEEITKFAQLCAKFGIDPPAEGAEFAEADKRRILLEAYQKWGERLKAPSPAS